VEGSFGTPLPLIMGLLAGLVVGVAWTLHHELVDRTEGQASMIAGRILAPGARLPGAWLTNGSERPVYGVVAWVVASEGMAPATGEDWVARIRAAAGPVDGGVVAREPSTPVLLPLLPPGVTALELPAWVSSGSGGRPAIEVAFTDATGRHWLRRGGGRLSSIDAPAWRHYGFTSPSSV
jgi:hypothetical protein